MKFGPLPVSRAAGAVLAHSTMAGDKRLKKGRVLSSGDVDLLRAAGIEEVIAVTLDDGDIGEDRAATDIVMALKVRNAEAKPAATGRVNLHSEVAGVLRVDKSLIDAINRVDPAITIATLPDLDRVEAGKMVATVKIIPFAAPRAAVDKVAALAASGEAFAIEPFAARSVGVVQTVLPSVKKTVLDKTLRVTEERLARSGSTIAREWRTPHREEELAATVKEAVGQSDMVLIFGASAMSDFDDVIPAAIRRAGGSVARAGMPVDPGNLMVLGEIEGKPVFGAPGCARSPMDNGFDWVLDRTMAGIAVTADDVAGMGVGGLLMEIVTRPQPREASLRAAQGKPHVLVLAAGRSSRMGGPNKLMAEFDGRPLVRRTVERALQAAPGRVTVVVGHQSKRVRAALEGLPVRIVENGDFATGLSSSLKAGIRTVADASGALVMLADMPAVEPGDIEKLIAAFEASGGRAIVRATHGGKRGNPVILPRTLFSNVETLQGDTGARALVEASDAEVVDVEIGAHASLDVDTPEAMRLAGGQLQD